MREFIVIGAGISGLTVAYKLAQAGKDVVVLESSEIAGGKVITVRVDGYLLESGPNSLRVDNKETVNLIDELGLTNRAIEANPASKKRFILKKGNWIQIPSKPGEAIATPLFSIGGKLRIVLEPFIPKTKSADESTASFVSRRLGNELFEYAADPFISGIYAGNPHNLSMKYAFPAMWNAEQRYGSLLKGMMKGRKKSLENKIKFRVISFPGGVSELTNTLRTQLGERLKLHNGAVSIAKSRTGFVVETSSGAHEASKIIFALPASDTSKMIAGLAPDLSKALLTIEYPPVAVVYLGYREAQFPTKPEGFGGLIPSKEHQDILGIIFSSSNFPNRAPKGHLLLTVLAGGARMPEIADWNESKIIQTAEDEVSNLLKPQGASVFQHVRLWPRAIPQYNMGYGAIMNAVDRAERDNPGLYFTGNYRGGIAMGACIKNATELAKRLV